MKALIRYKGVLEAIDPLKIAAYLRAHNWHEHRQIPEKASVWLKVSESGEEFEILLPLNRQLKDFSIRVAEILNTLEVEEQRSRVEILASLKTPVADIIYLRLNDIDFQDGAIPLTYGVNLHRHARNLLLFSACSVVESKAYFEQKKPEQANRFINNLRLGQSMHGSYILSIISPLQSTQELSFETVPFERKVINRLSNSLISAVEMAEYVLARDSESSLLGEAVERGISANLCEAIVGIQKIRSGQYRELELRFNLSPTIETSNDFPQEIILPKKSIHAIEKLGIVLKQSSYTNFDLRGEVIKLERQRSDRTGKVTALGAINEKQRKVEIELDEIAYNIAASANQERKIIACRGNLVQEGRKFRLESPSDFRIIK